MKTNRWIELSQHLYRRLLRLYPQAYRTTYETEMFCCFTSQCREAYQQRGRLGILFLWLRTFVDVGRTVVIEHISDPNARAGLLEATPGNPLPWKGVFLVLIPGLVFFVSQIAQVTSDMDWYFYVYFRAAFFLIVPVLLVWLLTRRFPVWGLIPLGLLYATLASYNPDYLISKLGLSPYDSILIYPTLISPGYLAVVPACAILLCGLIWYFARRQQISRSTWKWLGLYGFLIALKIAGEFYNSRMYQGWTSMDLRNFAFQMPFWYLYDALPFLLLIFIGKLFTRSHKGLSFLLLLGYLLPTTVVGRYGEGIESIPFSVVVVAVLFYRTIVALVAPIWLTRAVTFLGQRRAVAIPFAMAVFCHITISTILNLALANQFTYQLGFLDYVSSIWNQLIAVVGVALAVPLYFPGQKNAPVSPPFVAVTE